VVAELRGDDLLLNARKQLLSFGQCQTQVGDILKTIGPVELLDVDSGLLTIDPGSNQPQNPPHPRSLRRRRARRIVSLSSSSPQSLDSPRATHAASVEEVERLAQGHGAMVARIAASPDVAGRRRSSPVVPTSLGSAW
jgi:hypothetical protein